MLLQPLHEGDHNSAGDLDLGEWVMLAVIVLALVGIGYALYKVVQRRRGGGGDDQ